ncbi:MAG: hypothetical protein ABI301_06990 [Jatrophihabitantaceae bacterium]
MIGNDEQTIHALRDAMATEVRGHHLDPEIAAAATDQLGSARRHGGKYAAVAACAVGAVTVALVYAVTGSNAQHGATAPTGSACNGAVFTSALPVWARAGFSPDSYVNAHVTGAGDEIIGVLFADPLRSPPAPDRNNKILWVAKDPGTGPLVIRAHLEGADQEATRTVPGGPGPSIIDLPAPGCWKLTLTWSGHRDTLAVPYTG